MAEREPEQESTEARDPQSPESVEEEASSPFDHPAFLPVLLWGLASWFGYDGWINQDPDMLEHLTFNRWGFAVLVVLAVYFTVQSIRETRASREAGPDA